MKKVSLVELSVQDRLDRLVDAILDWWDGPKFPASCHLLDHVLNLAEGEQARRKRVYHIRSPRVVRKARKETP